LAYDSMLELASFFEQDAELQQQPDSNALPLDPEVRRPLRLLIRAAAPWLRRFPTVRELDDECGAFLRRPDLLNLSLLHQFLRLRALSVLFRIQMRLRRGEC